MIRVWLGMVLLTTALPAGAWEPNNPYGATWPNALPWRLNDAGSQSVPNLNTAEGILVASFDEWADQTCTVFDHSYNGRTGTSSRANSDGTTVMGFSGQWPQSYGDPYSVIGITTSRFSGFGGNWDIVEADVNFNEAVWTFVQGRPTRNYQADLESIAVHEFGHALGLGHTQVRGATMFPSYDGGTGSRSIAQDDVNGVCSLYPSGSGPLPGDDAYEDNDDAGTAAAIGCGSTINATAADQDWFIFATDSRGPITVTIRFDGSLDHDLYLFDEQAEIDRSEQSGTTSEEVSVTGAAAGTYFVVVNPYAGSGDYSLELACSGSAVPGPSPGPGNTPDDDYEDNDAADAGAEVACPDTLEAYAADQDWYVFETDGQGRIAATLSWEDTSADLDLYLIDQDGEVARSVQETGTEEAVDQGRLPAGTYAFVVNPFAGQSPYTLDMTCSANAGVDDGDAGADTGLLGDTGDAGPALPRTCACQQGLGGFGPWWLGLVAVGLVRRRRR